MILVTGGAGYIGSHVVKQLGCKGYDVVVYDNLSTGKKERIKHGLFIKGDLCDIKRLEHVFQKYNITSVMHFAADIKVDESVTNPSKYYKNNLVNSLNLMNLMNKYNVNNFIFSSTAAVYGNVQNTIVDESYSSKPINPYGKSKYMVEEILSDFSQAYNFNYVTLRYFNVAGADPDGEIGQDYKNSTHLITRTLKTVKGEYDKLQVFGDNYSTPDGTCIRDYIHVADLATAHILALDYLVKGGQSNTFNVGYNKGYSVKEVIRMVEKVTGHKVNYEIVNRRLGDAPAIIADNTKILSYLHWKPKYDDLEEIVRTSWEWEAKLLINN
ncbi:UDP-glucose 4-epimerase GalE [Priestia flexa]|uniref:UDP-glucose 4-epimerase GalE n=1 Tax=Priestia flexa TaxID=86664 RepID=UPI003D0434CB